MHALHCRPLCVCLFVGWGFLMNVCMWTAHLSCVTMDTCVVGCALPLLLVLRVLRLLHLRLHLLPLLLRMVQVFDWNKDGSHELIGSATTSVDDLSKRATSGDRLQLVNAAIKARKPGYTRSGLLRVVSFAVTPKPSFLDYITHGCELSFMVAIDFTGSNGDPRSPSSLHYIDPRGAPNQYHLAIESVGGVLE